MQTRLPQLDAIRGVAILMVIFHNQTPKYPSLHLEHIFANGWMGVDLFFVLSGFLITGILLDTKHSDGYFKNFYIRRCLRIWPLYYSVIFFMFVIVPFLRPRRTVLSGVAMGGPILLGESAAPHCRLRDLSFTRAAPVFVVS